MSHVYWIHHKEHTDISEGYIGVSKDPNRRINEHHSRGENPHLENAYKKYGKENIVCSLLLEGSDEYCYEIEKHNNAKPYWVENTLKNLSSL